MPEPVLITDSTEIHRKARTTADKLVRDYQSAHAQDDPALPIVMAKDMSVILLVSVAPRHLPDVATLQRIATEAIQATTWTWTAPAPAEPAQPKPATRAKPVTEPLSKPTPKIYTLVPSVVPGHYALDTPTGRTLLQGDHIILLTGIHTKIPVVLCESTQISNGKGRFLSDEGEHDGPIAITESGNDLVGLCIGMRVRLLDESEGHA